MTTTAAFRPTGMHGSPPPATSSRCPRLRRQQVNARAPGCVASRRCHRASRTGLPWSARWPTARAKTFHLRVHLSLAVNTYGCWPKPDRMYHRQRPSALCTTPATATKHSAQETDTVAFNYLRAYDLLWSAPSGFAWTPAWTNHLWPPLQQARCSVEDAAVHATDKGSPMGKKRIFAVAVKRRPGMTLESHSAKLAKPRLHQLRRAAAYPTIRVFLGRIGPFFVKRLPGVSSFPKPRSSSPTETL